MAYKILITGTRGGVGKTTSVKLISQVLAKAGNRVLMADLTFNSDLTENCMGAYNPEGEGMKCIFQDGWKPENVAENLDIACSNVYMRFAERYLLAENLSEFLQKQFIPYEKQYDYIIIDSSEPYTLLFDAAVNYCDRVVVSLKLDAGRAEDLIFLEKYILTVSRVKKHINGMYLNACSPLSAKGMRYFVSIPQDYKDGLLLKTEIHRNVSVTNCFTGRSEMSAGQKCGEEYVALVKEILTRI